MKLSSVELQGQDLGAIWKTEQSLRFILGFFSIPGRSATSLVSRSIMGCMLKGFFVFPTGFHSPSGSAVLGPCGHVKSSKV